MVGILASEFPSCEVKLSERNRGYAARLFLERLTADLERAMDVAAELRRRWLAGHLPGNPDGQVRRVAVGAR